MARRSLTTFFVIAVCISSSALAADRFTETVFDNEKIRLSRVQLPAGAATRISTAPSVIICLSTGGFTARIRGSQERIFCDVDDVIWNDDAVTRLANNDAAPVTFLVGEVKDKPSGPMSLPDDDATRTLPDAFRLLFENDHLRIVREKHPAGSKLAMHSHPGWTLQYPIVPAQLRLVNADGSTFNRQNTPGMPIWIADAERHESENIGEGDDYTLLIELR